jgi:hypothetical protein
MRKLPLSILFATSLIAVTAAADEFDQVKRVSQTATSETWRIDRPNVKRPSSDYPQIHFRPRDRVRLAAGGCVQTGGTGQTWKRYVNPSGPNTPRLYYGRFYTPAICGTGPLVRLRDVVGRWISVPDDKAADCAGGLMNLRLGYVDDNYDDNGYWEHDDGTENQCQGVGPAWVTVEIQHAQ